MQNISGYGLKIQVVASNIFPQGFTVTQLADDTDPFEVPSMQIVDGAMGVNGDLVTWSKANPIKISLGVVPGGDDDRNLAILFETNRVGLNKNSTNDVITMTGIYPDGSFKIFINGKMTDGMPSNAVASAGRLKSKVYNFIFENQQGSI